MGYPFTGLIAKASTHTLDNRNQLWPTKFIWVNNRLVSGGKAVRFWPVGSNFYIDLKEIPMRGPDDEVGEWDEDDATE